MSKSSFTCPWLRARGLARRLRKWMMFENLVSVDDNKVNKKNIIIYNPFIIVDDIEILNVGEWWTSYFIVGPPLHVKFYLNQPHYAIVTYRCINFNSHLLVTNFILYIFLSSSILFSLFQLESFFALPPKERKFVPRPSAQLQAILDVCSIPLQREITLKKITEIVHVFLYYY